MKRILLSLAPVFALYAQAPSDAEIRAILVERIDKLQQGVGIVAGVVTPEGRRFVSYGTFGVADSRPVAPDSVFEIGSVTKVFTSLLLADMVQRGEVSLDDPVAKYLPAEVKVPERGGKKITLVDLATHTSALPRLPSNLAPKDASNPYADYSVEQLYGFLSGYELTRDIGSKMDYSNLGVGLLGHALARRTGMDYETLVRNRITGPLKMDDTGIRLSAAMKKRLAKGHNETRQPAGQLGSTDDRGRGRAAQRRARHAAVRGGAPGIGGIAARARDGRDDQGAASDGAAEYGDRARMDHRQP